MSVGCRVAVATGTLLHEETDRTQSEYFVKSIAYFCLTEEAFTSKIKFRMQRDVIESPQFDLIRNEIARASESRSRVYFRLIAQHYLAVRALCLFAVVTLFNDV